MKGASPETGSDKDKKEKGLSRRELFTKGIPAAVAAMAVVGNSEDVEAAGQVEVFKLRKELVEKRAFFNSLSKQVDGLSLANKKKLSELLWREVEETYEVKEVPRRAGKSPVNDINMAINFLFDSALVFLFEKVLNKEYQISDAKKIVNNFITSMKNLYSVCGLKI